MSVGSLKDWYYVLKGLPILLEILPDISFLTHCHVKNIILSYLRFLQGKEEHI